MSDYSNKDQYYRWQVTALDVDGYDLLCRRDFLTKKEAKAFAKEIANDRSYFVQKAESETFPDEVALICLFDYNELAEDFSPAWKS